MAEPFIAEIRIFAGNFAIRNWAFCNGALLGIAQNSALFSLVGTIYGGDGETTFGLPNLQGRAPMHAGNGPGLTQRRVGETGGVTTVTLTDNQMPSHSHVLRASSETEDPLPTPPDNAFARTSGPFVYQQDTTNNLVDVAPETLPSTGGGQAHNNVQPHLVLNFLIALSGQFPSQN